MERHYQPLRPAPRSSEDNPERPGRFEAGVPKRRRVGVSVACNTCRSKKIRCDGQRPVCTNCLGSTTLCAYRDDSDLSQESRRLLVEVIRLLHNMPAAETIRTLKLLGTETHAPTILSTLRGSARLTDESSTDNYTNAKASDRLEFEIEYPTAYPTIPGLDTAELDSTLGTVQSEQIPPDDASFSEPHGGEMHRGPSHSAHETAYNLRSRSPSTTPGGQPGGHRQASPPELCDRRLQQLNIAHWTNVEISNDTAARCISLYLQTDHPLLGHFDPESFVSDLVLGQSQYCSSLLVNSLLYWACQMYSAIDTDTDHLAIKFCTEAESLWAMSRDKKRDSLLNIAAAEFLCLGYLGQGRDHAIVAYVSEASSMGQRMGLFGTKTQNAPEEPSRPGEAPDEATKARMYTSWGVFNWITLMSLFYRQPGLSSIEQPPVIAIPQLDQSGESPFSPGYMGQTFPHICRFWAIMSEVSTVYSGDGQRAWGSSSSLPFAEYKFRELLAWSKNMPSRLSQSHRSPHHVQILHLWFHAAILDIFRPHIQRDLEGNRHLRTFTSGTITPDAVCEASVAQLLHLITNYRLNYQSSAYTILWHTALIYVINAILNGTKESNWYSDLLLCIYSYEGLGRSWRVASGIAKGLLSLIMQKSDITSRSARRILKDLERKPDQFPEQMRATFMADLSLALSDPASATVEHLAEQFEDNVLLKDYTTSLDGAEDGWE